VFIDVRLSVVSAGDRWPLR